MAEPGLYRRNLERFRANYAAELGCDESAFSSDALTVVSRPESARQRDPVFVATFGTGTVISVLPQYLDWVSAFPLERHFHAFNIAGFVAAMRAELERRGEPAASRSTGLGFVAERIPAVEALPAGVQHRLIDGEWRQRNRASGVFHNSLGEPTDGYADQYWRWGVALVDSTGKPVAVAGTYDDGPALLEIGVDVAREHRGRGLAAAVVTLLSREIHVRGLTATYYCAASNVRSHRTSLASGFVPVATNTGLRRPPEATA